MSINGDAVDRTAYACPVPQAKNDPSRVFTETVDDSVIVLDVESMHYHTLNSTAAKVWELCDGRRSILDITRELGSSGFSTTEEAVALAVAELGEAELLTVTPPIGESRLHRRRALKLVAAGLIGSTALPLVESISVPRPAAAASGDCCDSCPGLAACISVLGFDVNVCATGLVCPLLGCPAGFQCWMGLTCVLDLCIELGTPL